MERKVLFQTLKNKGNFDFVSKNGPFPCSWKNTWLGTGYYYWDAFVQSAHWWGRVRYNDNHIICQCECYFESNVCFDLAGGSTDHLGIFADCVELMIEQNLINDKTTVARVIQYMRKTLKIFKYKAIRAYGIDSVSKYKKEYEEFSFRLIFEPNKIQYLDYRPVIQICIFEKFDCGLKDFRVIYPNQYDAMYVV